VRPLRRRRRAGKVWSRSTTFAHGPSSPPLTVADSGNNHTVVATSRQRASDGRHRSYVVDYGAEGKVLWRKSLGAAYGQPTAMAVSGKSHQIRLLMSDSSSVRLVALWGDRPE
jgi:hypothetical protein